MAKLALDEMAVERVSAIYESFVEDLTLTGAARRDMKKRRGFTDETIDALKFRSIGNKKLVEAAMKATGATEDELLAVKLLVDGKHGPYPNPQLTKMPERARDAVLLPYISNHGQISKLRVHRNNFWKDGIRPYCGRVGKTYEGDDVDLILCEGEFKAAALYQEGYAALAVPGISSFAGDHFDQLVEAIGHIRHKRLIVCFDREIKNDPTLAGFKSNYRKRWDTEFYTWLMAHRLDGYVAMLPKDWMVEGKVDFDQALAAGRGRADFDAIFAKAVTPLRFLDQLE
ncbi:MAG: DUF3854 domain-containing protein, partial [Planctomycetota bacterium]|nr:DUF3854 domain-containing protein [Planctomycetota bacterium]